MNGPLNTYMTYIYGVIFGISAVLVELEAKFLKIYIFYFIDHLKILKRINPIDLRVLCPMAHFSVSQFTLSHTKEIGGIIHPLRK